MLRAYALADLFEANLDGNAEGFFLTTTGGNLIGTSPHMPLALTKRLSVLGALTWRFHAAAATPRHHASVGTSASSVSSHGGLTMAPSTAANGDVAREARVSATGVRDAHISGMAVRDPHNRTNPLPVLRVVVGSSGEGLQELTIECDGRVCTLEYVREGLLVGAVSGSVDNQSDEHGNSIGDVAAQSENISAATTDLGDTEHSQATSGRRDQLVRFLTIKASAMADYLRDELRDFRMPTGLE